MVEQKADQSALMIFLRNLITRSQIDGLLFPMGKIFRA